MASPGAPLGTLGTSEARIESRSQSVLYESILHSCAEDSQSKDLLEDTLDRSDRTRLGLLRAVQAEVRLKGSTLGRMAPVNVVDSGGNETGYTRCIAATLSLQ